MHKVVATRMQNGINAQGRGNTDAKWDQVVVTDITCPPAHLVQACTEYAADPRQR